MQMPLQQPPQGINTTNSTTATAMMSMPIHGHGDPLVNYYGSFQTGTEKIGGTHVEKTPESKPKPMVSNGQEVSPQQNKVKLSSDVAANQDKENKNVAKNNRLCTIAGCKKRVRSKGLCKAHGGGRRCMVDGCERSSQGQGLCIRHGGGKRCTHNGCSKASQSNGLCKAHGGGLRCQANGCFKSSQGGGFCRAHGGGQRCEREGCNKGAQRGGFCAGHGGSRFCQAPDCTKNDRGGGFCAEHGGGKRCDEANCNKPARKKGKCSFHANAAAKNKAAKDALNVPTAQPHMMPVYNNNLSMHKDTSSFEHMRAHPSAAAPVQYQHDPRYTKAYAEQSVPLNSVLPHGSFMGLHQEQQRYDPRTAHYMNTMESAASTGYTPKHVQMDRNTAHYIPREMMKTGQSPYPHWTTHDHAAYSQQAAASYHHMADYGAHRDAYYHHAGPDVAGAPNMMYYQTGGYQTQPHQMQSMQQMTLL